MERYYCFWRRLLAGLIDGFVLLPILIIGNKIFSIEQSSYYLFLLIFRFIIASLYSVLLTGLVGQTVGKMLLGLKVLDLDEQSVIGIKRAFYRDSVSIALESIVVIYSVYLFTVNGFIDEASHSSLDSAIDWASISWLLLEMITMFTNSKRRAVHDYFASSVVISIKGLKFDKIDEDLRAKSLLA